MPRTIIVGDIHGCFDELRELVDVVNLRPADLLISVGDLVDRGPSPGEVVRYFRERPNSVVVMGNHERKHVRGVFSYAQEITRLQLGADYADVVGWMRTLPYYFENEHARVVHAALVPGEPLAAQPEELLCGSTSGEKQLTALFPDGHWHDRYRDRKPVVFGHHVTGREPLIRDGRVFGLDTGACHGWNLTALCLPESTICAVPAKADHWADVKVRWQLPVLKSRPWLDYTWSELEQAAERHTAGGTADWLAALRSWAADLRALLPTLVEAAHVEAAPVEAAPVEAAHGQDDLDRLRRHPASDVLFQARNGRLSLATVTRRCATPRRTLDLAAALAVPAPVMEGFGGTGPS